MDCTHERYTAEYDVFCEGGLFKCFYFGKNCSHLVICDCFNGDFYIFNVKYFRYEYGHAVVQAVLIVTVVVVLSVVKILLQQKIKSKSTTIQNDPCQCDIISLDCNYRCITVGLSVCCIL